MDGALMKCSLFLGLLSHLCTEEDLLNVFSEYGQIINVYIKRDVQEDQTLTYGFVNFLSAKAANNAKKNLNGTSIHGVKLKISWTSSTNSGYESVVNVSDPGSNSEVGNKQSSSQIHVSYVSDQVKIVVTVESLNTLFSKYGTVHDIIILKHTINKTNPPFDQNGHGFIHFANDESGVAAAREAVAKVNRQSINGIVYNCEFSYRTKTNKSFISGRKASGGNSSPPTITHTLSATSMMPAVQMQSHPSNMRYVPRQPSPVGYYSPNGLFVPVPGLSLSPRPVTSSIAPPYSQMQIALPVDPIQMHHPYAHQNVFHSQMSDGRPNAQYGYQYAQQQELQAPSQHWQQPLQPQFYQQQDRQQQLSGYAPHHADTHRGASPSYSHISLSGQPQFRPPVVSQPPVRYASSDFPQTSYHQQQLRYQQQSLHGGGSGSGSESAFGGFSSTSSAHTSRDGGQSAEVSSATSSSKTNSSNNSGTAKDEARLRAEAAAAAIVARYANEREEAEETAN